jgi:hypothetical protein
MCGGMVYLTVPTGPGFDSRKNPAIVSNTKTLFLFFFFILSNFFYLVGDPELDAQVPAADLSGAAARGGGRPASHQHTAGALQELRLPGDPVHRRHRLSKPTGTSWAFTEVPADLNIRTITLNPVYLTLISVEHMFSLQSWKPTLMAL